MVDCDWLEVPEGEGVVLKEMDGVANELGLTLGDPVAEALERVLFGEGVPLRLGDGESDGAALREGDGEGDAPNESDWLAEPL